MKRKRFKLLSIGFQDHAKVPGEFFLSLQTRAIKIFTIKLDHSDNITEPKP